MPFPLSGDTISLIMRTVRYDIPDSDSSTTSPIWSRLKRDSESSSERQTSKSLANMREIVQRISERMPHP